MTAPTQTATDECVPVVIVVSDGPWEYVLQYNRPPAVCASVVLGAAWRIPMAKSNARANDNPGGRQGDRHATRSTVV